MKSRIIRIGRSYGVRIPNPLVEQTKLSEEVEISVQGTDLVIRAINAKRPRAGWEAAARLMAQRGEDGLLWDETSELDS
jgi:antitoxin MazE